MTAKLDALRCAGTLAADDAAVGPRNGVRTTAHYVASRTLRDPAPVRADTTLARWLIDFSTLADAFTNGVLTEPTSTSTANSTTPAPTPHWWPTRTV